MRTDVDMCSGAFLSTAYQGMLKFYYFHASQRRSDHLFCLRKSVQTHPQALETHEREPTVNPKTSQGRDTANVAVNPLSELPAFVQAGHGRHAKGVTPVSLDAPLCL